MKHFYHGGEVAAYLMLAIAACRHCAQINVRLGFHLPLFTAAWGLSPLLSLWPNSPGGRGSEHLCLCCIHSLMHPYPYSPWARPLFSRLTGRPITEAILAVILVRPFLRLKGKAFASIWSTGIFEHRMYYTLLVEYSLTKIQGNVHLHSVSYC